MKKKKSILAGSVLTGAALAVAGLTAQASGLFSHHHLGTGEEIRTTMTNGGVLGSKTLDLKCGGKKTDSTKVTKGKEGKCGEGKCGGAKAKKGKKSAVKAKKAAAKTMKKAN